MMKTSKKQNNETNIDFTIGRFKEGEAETIESKIAGEILSGHLITPYGDYDDRVDSD